MTRNRELRGATGAFGPKCREPCSAVANNRGHARDALGVVDRGRLAIEAVIGRERWLEARPALLALERLQQRRFLATDVRTSADESVNIDIDAAALHILAKQARVVSLFDRRLEARKRLVHEFATHVVVRNRRAHRVRRDRHPFNQCMRVEAQDLAVVTGAGLGFVGVDDKVLLAVEVLRHEAPLETGRESGAAATTQARRLNFLDDLFRLHLAGKNPAPGLVTVVLLIGRKRPRLVRAEGVETHEVLFVSHYSSPSRISSTISLVRFS